MKKIVYLLLMVLLAKNIFAQAPLGINYQGVARTGAGLALGNTNISLEFKIYTGNPNLGSAVLEYTETHTSVLTDTFGLYSLKIGNGSVTTGPIFSQILWSTGNKWIQISIDSSNGTSYNLVSRQQLMSVPYALYAETSGNGGSGSISAAPHNIPKINPSGTGTKNSLIFESADSSSIGINNPTPLVDALLDLTSPPTAVVGKGLLIPRMTDLQRTNMPVSALHHGMLVFQVNSPNVLSPQGFWYYDAVAGAWLMFAPTQAVWTLSGNPFTNPGTNYIGTMDDKDVVFKTGNAVFSQFERMRIYNNSKGGNVQFGDGSAVNSYVFPAAKGAAGDILQLDPSGTTNDLIWKPLPSAGNVAWLTSGNIGAGGDFLGTTGAFPLQIGTTNTVSPQPILFNVNGGEQMRISAPQGFVGINTNSPLSRLHVTESSAFGPQVYVQNTAANEASTIKLGTFGGGGNIETIISATDGGAGFQVGRVGTVTNHDLIFITGASAAEQMRIDVSGNVGIGVNVPNYKLDVAGSSTTAVLNVANSSTSGGDAINGYVQGSGSAVTGVASGTGAGIFGYGVGSAGAGFFQVGNSSSSANVLYVDHQGLGTSAYITTSNPANPSPIVEIANAGTGPSLFAHTIGPGSAASFTVNSSTNASAAVNIGTNGTGDALFATANGGGSAGRFQVTSNTTSSPALFASTGSPAPALLSIGNGGVGSISALFNGGSVGVNTGTVNPTSGLDVKTSLGLSVKNYPNAGNFAIPINDPNVVHIIGISGTTTFTMPDATLCPGRVLVFTSVSPTTGTMIVQACCSQTVNGGPSQSYTLTSGASKPSVGVISDGSNWQIIFKN